MLSSLRSSTARCLPRGNFNLIPQRTLFAGGRYQGRLPVPQYIGNSERARYDSKHEEKWQMRNTLLVAAVFATSGALLMHKSVKAASKDDPAAHEDRAVVFVVGTGEGKDDVIDDMIQRGYLAIRLNDLLAGEIEEMSEDGQRIKRAIERNEEVPTDVCIRLIKQAMRRGGTKQRRYVLDDFPRNLEQALEWDAQLADHYPITYIVQVASAGEIKPESDVSPSFKKGMEHQTLASDVVAHYKGRSVWLDAHKPEDSHRTITQMLDGIEERLKDRLSKTAEYAKETTAGTFEKVKGDTSTLIGKAKGLASSAKEKVGEAVETVEEDVKGGFETAKEKLTDMLGRAKKEVTEEIPEKGKEFEEGAREKVKEIGDKTKQKGKEIEQRAKDKVKDIDDKGKEMAGKAKTAGEDVKQKVEGGAKELREKVEKTKDEAEENLKEKGESAKSYAQALGSSIKSKVDEGAENVKEKAEGIAEYVKGKGEELKENVKEKTAPGKDVGDAVKEKAKELQQKAAGYKDRAIGAVYTATHPSESATEETVVVEEMPAEGEASTQGEGSRGEEATATDEESLLRRTDVPGFAMVGIGEERFFERKSQEVKDKYKEQRKQKDRGDKGKGEGGQKRPESFAFEHVSSS